MPKSAKTPKSSSPSLPDFSDAYSITILDTWMGFSPIAPIKALYIIEEDTWENCFEGAALFSVGHEYHAARRTAVTINVPVKAVESFLKKLATARPEKGVYEPSIQWTDDYPKITVRVCYGRGQVIEFATRSQGEAHIPWQVIHAGKAYVVNSGGPAQALQQLAPYLARDVLRQMTEQESSRWSSSRKG